MYVNYLDISFFRSFEKLERIRLDKINVLVGANNSGKSSILKALHLLQADNGVSTSDIRLNFNQSRITIGLSDITSSSAWGNLGDIGSGHIDIYINAGSGASLSYQIISSDGSTYNVAAFQNTEPHHFIVPYYSKRKTASYEESISSALASQVSIDLRYLAAKLNRLSNPGYSKHSIYKTTCEKILGFFVTSIPSDKGMRVGTYLPDNKTIFIDQMGEGIPNIVALLAELAISENKLFLIEEPENDLHPKALKALLDLIIESSKSNQFVISTHSNIVVRHLASAESSLLYNISADPNILPTLANVNLVESNAEARLTVLRDLGYEFSDFELWDGWLILEESSAERIIRDYLIPWFTPKLSRVRTLSTNGADQVASTFEDFNRLVRFTHLEDAYRNSAWVRIDGDDKGLEITSRLRTNYPSWSPDRFGTFSKKEFERYYPEEFSEKINSVLSITDKQELRQAKKNLLEEVRIWLDKDLERGKASLNKSAKEIIDDLIVIESQLKL